MLITRFKLKLFIQSFLIVLCTLIVTAPIHAGYTFSDTPTKTQQATQKKIKKKDKRLKKKLQNWKSKFSKNKRRDDYFGRLALISIGLAVFCSFLTVLSYVFSAGIFIGLLVSVVFAAIGSKKDKNPTKARIVFFIYVLALVIVLSIAMISAIG